MSRYYLRRTTPSDGAGDSGPYSEALRLNDKKELERGGARPVVGYVMRVGSIVGRSYQMQDYWTTTYVLEILEDTPEKVIFRTGNSTYEWGLL